MGKVYPQSSDTPVQEWALTSCSPYVKNYTDERKKRLVALLPEGSRLLKFHKSLCPGCVDEEKFSQMTIDAVTFARNGKVWLIKKCEEHGIFKELSWSDFEMYRKAEKFQDPGIELETTNIDKYASEIECPLDCGLCSEHESHTQLGNIVVTNRCDLSCWYCFFYSKEGDPIYEPTMDQIRLMLQRMRDEKPVGANSIQFTGGEPTLRDDLVDIVKAASEIGYEHIQLNTNGVNLAKSPELTMKLREAGVSNLYMSFDGVTPETNPKNYWEAPKAIENCGKAGIGVVLVPTVIGGINDHELGDMIRFANGHLETVRSINFQPVSLVGRMPDSLRKKQRITIPGAIRRIEEQMDGQIAKEHWFPVPCTKNIVDFIQAVKQQPVYRLSVHFQCGMATYVFRDNETGKLVPLPAFFDVPGFFEYLGELTEEINNSLYKSVKKSLVITKLLVNINKFVDDKKKPKDLKFIKMLSGILSGGNFGGLEEFHLKSLFLGMMHFQDPYNWDIDRVHKCGIHYATPDGRILPFCTFNVIPQLYRDRVQQKFSLPPAEWEKLTGKKLASDKHIRNLTDEQKSLIRAEYDKFRKSSTRIETSDWGNEDDNINDPAFVPIKKLLDTFQGK